MELSLCVPVKVPKWRYSAWHMELAEAVLRKPKKAGIARSPMLLAGWGWFPLVGAEISPLQSRKGTVARLHPHPEWHSGIWEAKAKQNGQQALALHSRWAGCAAVSSKPKIRSVQVSLAKHGYAWVQLPGKLIWVGGIKTVFCSATAWYSAVTAPHSNISNRVMTPCKDIKVIFTIIAAPCTSGGFCDISYLFCPSCIMKNQISTSCCRVCKEKRWRPIFPKACLDFLSFVLTLAIQEQYGHSLAPSQGTARVLTCSAPAQWAQGTPNGDCVWTASSLM